MQSNKLSGAMRTVSASGTDGRTTSNLVRRRQLGRLPSDKNVDRNGPPQMHRAFTPRKRVMSSVMATLQRHVSRRAIVPDA